MIPVVPEPVILAVAPNGARRNRADHPAVPMTPPEIAEAAAGAAEEGASMLHLHVRDAAGSHTLDPAAYQAAIAAVRSRVGGDLVVQATTEAVGRYSAAEQMAMVRAVRPEGVSLALRELAPDQRSEPALADFLRWLRAEAIVPQFILYSPTDMQRFLALRNRGLIEGFRHFLMFVLGRYGGTGANGMAAAPKDLLPFLSLLPPKDIWMTCAFGQAETNCLVTAAALGGHARVGFENNLLNADGAVAHDNKERVNVIREGIERLGWRPATAGELRAVLAALD